MSSVPKKSRLDESTDAQTASDDGSPSGFIRYEVAVADISAPGGASSPTIEVLGMPWHLKVKKVNRKLAMHLYHRSSDCDMWSINASVELNVINNEGETIQLNQFDHTYSHMYGSWGLRVIKWQEFISEEMGFIKDGKAIFEARFALSKLVGIRTIPRIDYLDSNEPFNDVTLVINGEKIYVSKQLLAIYSLHFKSLFYGKDSANNKEEIELNDIDRKEFIEILNLIYPSYSKISDSNAESLLNLADRFEIKTIIDQVEKFLIDSSKLNVPLKLNLSDKYKLVKLQEHCLRAFDTFSKITDFQSTTGYESLSRSAKATLLEKVMKLGKPRDIQNPLLDNYDDSLMASNNDSPSGFIRFEVAVSSINPCGIFSPVINVSGLPWSLFVQQMLASSSLGVFLSHRRSDSDIWSVDVSAELKLCNIDKDKNKSYHLNNAFKHNAVNWGCRICAWDDILDKNKGFIKDGKIIFEANFLIYNLLGIRVNSPIGFTDRKESFHDVALVIGGEKVYVSKQILAIHSSFFKTMFFGDFAEKNKEEVELKEVDREVFIDMLNLIYPSPKKITDANAEPLLKLADQFQIKVVIDQVEQYLIDSTKFNIPVKLNLSDKYRLVALQEHCLDTFKTIKDIVDLKSTDGYNDLSKNIKGTLLDKATKLNWDT